MMNVGNPEEAFRSSFIPNDGVGLAREEFIITTYIKIHPLALLDYDRLDDAAAQAEIDRLTAGYADKPQFFVDKLAAGRRDDRRGVLSQGRDPAAERLQDQRVRQPDRRPSLTSRPRRIRCSASAAPRATTTRATGTASPSNAGR